MSHIAITLSAPGELRDVLVAQLSEAGYEGFEETTEALIAYIPEAMFNEAALQEIVQAHGIAYTKEAIAQANWNAVWESSFQPVLVDDFCGIRAGFHEPLGEKVQHEIVITPKMSFGTGHHATTYSMIQLMRDVDFKGKQVFDFGTGTGILAILADKLGAVHTDAIDIDDWAVENSLENAAANHAERIHFRQADSLNGLPAQHYDIVLANINRNILLASMPHMKKILRGGGLLILSGILQEDEPAIAKAAAVENLHLERKANQEHWLALSFRNS